MFKGSLLSLPTVKLFGRIFSKIENEYFWDPCEDTWTDISETYTDNFSVRPLRRAIFGAKQRSAVWKITRSKNVPLQYITAFRLAC